jgi:branched-subunit amino acid transport protein
MSNLEAVIAIVGLGLITMLTRAFFMLQREEVPLPTWFREGLRFAPLAALVAVIAPDVLMKNGALIDTWRSPQLFAALVGMAYYAWRRGMFGTIIVGLVVLLLLRFGLGW